MLWSRQRENPRPCEGNRGLFVETGGLLGALALFAHSHADFDWGAFEAVGFAQAARDEAAVAWVEKAGGEEHKLWWSA